MCLFYTLKEHNIGAENEKSAKFPTEDKFFSIIDQWMVEITALFLLVHSISVSHL